MRGGTHMDTVGDPLRSIITCCFHLASPSRGRHYGRRSIHDAPPFSFSCGWSVLFFFGVASSEQFEGLLDDAEQRAMLRNWMRTAYCPHDDAVGDDVSTQTEQEFIELDVAEAMVREALVIGNEGIAQEVARRVAAEERTEAAELLACQLRSELASQSELLEHAKRERGRERASRQAAEQRVADEQGLRRAAEQLAADAAVAQQVAEQHAAAAEQRAAAAEAVWQDDHKERGGRRDRGGCGGRGGRGNDSSSTHLSSRHNRHQHRHRRLHHCHRLI